MPTTIIITHTKSGHALSDALPWPDAYNAAEATSVALSDHAGPFGPYKFGEDHDKYWLRRRVVYFDTSVIPEGVTITGARIRCSHGWRVFSDSTTARVYLVHDTSEVRPLYPIEKTCFNRTHYDSLVASAEIDGLTPHEDGVRYVREEAGIGGDSVPFLELSEAQAQAWIQRGTGAVTKGIFRFDHDYNNVAHQVHSKHLWFYPREISVGANKFQLLVDYTTAPEPTVETRAITDKEPTEATLNGEVVDTGGVAILERGFDYWDDVASEPANLWTESNEDFGLGSFNYKWTGLTINTWYSIRAKARNSVGWGYGYWVSFYTGAQPLNVTTLGAEDIEQYKATLAGAIQIVGFWQPATTRGFRWREQNGEVWTHSWTESGEFYEEEFRHTPNLQPGTIYEFQAMAENVTGWSYGGILEFTTLPFPPFIPTVLTQGVTNIHTTTALVYGSIEDTGGEDVFCYERGFYWGTSPGNTPVKVYETGSFGVGPFSLLLTGLPSGTTIYYRAFATNDGGTGYGEERSFTTLVSKEVVSNWPIAFDNVLVGQAGVVNKLVERHGECHWP